MEQIHKRFTAEQVKVLPKGEDLKIHQTIVKRVKDSIIEEATIERLECKDCHYTYRICPEGVREYSGRSKRLVFSGTILI